MRTILLSLTLATLIAGCDNAERSPDTIATTPVGNASGYVKRVMALPIGQQRGVVVRAIQDGGGDCQTITEFKPQPVQQGNAVWAVRCENGARWIVTMNDAGLATASGLPATG